MGLDMFVNKVMILEDKTKEVNTEFLEETGLASGESIEIHYWRKHPDMHGMMEEIYREKGGREEEFNCIEVYLDSEDIDKIEEQIKTGDLPLTEGFFFGQSSSDRKEDDLEFIKKARLALKEGYKIYYTSWW